MSNRLDASLQSKISRLAGQVVKNQFNKLENNNNSNSSPHGSRRQTPTTPVVHQFPSTTSAGGNSQGRRGKAGTNKAGDIITQSYDNNSNNSQQLRIEEEEFGGGGGADNNNNSQDNNNNKFDYEASNAEALGLNQSQGKISGKRRQRENYGNGKGGSGGPNGGVSINNNGGGPSDSNAQQLLSSTGVVPTETLEELGGLDRELPLIRELVELPLRFPHLFSRIGADPPSGVLLHGPPGCGKTKLVRALAGTFRVPLYSVSAPEIVQGVSGDSEALLRALFLEATANAPSIIFIDEIDTIAGRRESASKDMERRIVAQLLTCLDQLGQSWKEQRKCVCVMGATNRPEAIDTALRRAGRFDREIALGIPTTDERTAILKVLTKGITFHPDIDLHRVAMSTPGYVGADLQLLVKEAGVLAIRRKYRELEDSNELENTQSTLLNDFCIELEDMKDAVGRVQPSAMREGFSTIPNVTWDDVGALEDTREELQTCILQPIRAPKLHRRFGLDQPTGALLFGPPGCGKTLVAKAIAHESGANFISVKGPELLNKFVGESERAVRGVFSRARASAPCVLFFDELDALAPTRGGDRANPSSERVVNQLLTELDGVDGREGVFVIAATNRPDMIDKAMLRPGRLDKLLYVPLPSPAQRVSVLKTIARKFPLHPENVDLEALGLSDELDGFSGADLASVVREASLLALKQVYGRLSAETIDELEKRAFDRKGKMIEVVAAELGLSEEEMPFVTMAHFKEAASKIVPSVSISDRQNYDNLYAQHLESKKRGK